MGGVQVHEHHLVRARQQRRALGQRDQRAAQHRVQLLHMPVAKRAQERPERRGGPELVEHHLVAGVPQPIHVLDRVRPRDHPRHQRHHLRRRVRPRAVGRPLDRHQLAHQLGQAHLLGQRHHRDQPPISAQVRVITRDVDRARGMRRLHLAGASSS